MKRNAIKVCIRTRPTQYFAQDAIIIDEEHSTIQITNNHGVEPGGMLNNKQNSFKFRFDHVFHNSSQSAVYDLFARDTVQGVVDGINGAVMTYGQTGSGKTFTMVQYILFSSNTPQTPPIRLSQTNPPPSPHFYFFILLG